MRMPCCLKKGRKKIMIGKPVVTVALLFGLLAAVCPGQTAWASEKRNLKGAESFSVPDVVLTNQNGEKVRLRSLLQTGKPVILDFIYSTCTTTCPVLSAGYASLQNRFGPDSQKVQLVSISIDPEKDRPQVMKEYLKRYHARPGWDFLTGDVDEIAKVLTAFRTNEMNDNFFTLVRSPGAEKWTRILGRLSAAQIQDEYLK
jgi:protein SCO1